MRRAAVVALAALLGGGCGRGKPEPAAPAGTARIVSLAPSLTEIVCAVGAGDQLVGRTEVCNWPPEVARLPVVGGFGRPSLEAILALRPTLVLDVDLEDTRALDGLRETGIARRQVPCRTLEQVPDAIRSVGALTGRAAAAAELAAQLAAQLDALRRARGSAEAGPRVFVEIWGDPLMTAARHSFVSQLVALAGGRNLGDEIGADYCHVSSEWVVSRDPDAILCLYMASDTNAHLRVAARPGWQALRAVREGRVHDGFNTDLLFRPGPRVLDGVEALRQALGPGARDAPLHP